MSNSGRDNGLSLQVGTAAMELRANPVTATMRVYYSSYHLWAAKHFAVLALNIENQPAAEARFDIRHRAYVTNSIFSAVAFLEATVNELFQDASDDHESYLKKVDEDSKRLMADFWQLTEERNRSPFSILDKFQLALTFFRERRFDGGARPYQDANMVIRLRNELVHYKPISLGGQAEHKFSQQLRGKFRDNTLMDDCGNPWYPDKCLGYGCAVWATSSVVQFADEFYSRINVVPNYQRIKWETP